MSDQKREPTLEERYLEESGWVRQGDADSWVNRGRFGSGYLPDFPTADALDMQRKTDLRRLAVVLGFGSVDALVLALISKGLYPAAR